MIARASVLRIQGAYYLLTGLWPLVHFSSFEAITGPKVDDWLVRMVGLLAAVIGATLVVARQQKKQDLQIGVLAIGTALAFTGVDVWYTLQGRIARVYLADAAVEMVLVGLFLSARRPA